MISLLLLGSSHPAEALSGKQSVDIGASIDCWIITELELSKIGYVTLKFERAHFFKYYCSPNKIYNVTTSPKGQIRGAKGVRGQTPNEVFYIQVTTETKVIWLKYQKSVKNKQTVENNQSCIFKNLENIKITLPAS